MAKQEKEKVNETFIDLFNPEETVSDPEVVFYSSEDVEVKFGGFLTDFELGTNCLLEIIVTLVKKLDLKQAQDYIMNNGLKLCAFDKFENYEEVINYNYIH